MAEDICEITNVAGSRFFPMALSMVSAKLVQKPLMDMALM